jgi:DNA-binding NarL/FixJ family response regulator
MDLRMPGMDGVEATRRIRAAQPETQVLVLTTYADDESLFPALQAGANGYLTKDATSEEIASAIRALAAGKTHINRIFYKTGARDRAQAVRYAYEHQLV